MPVVRRLALPEVPPAVELPGAAGLVSQPA
jgi:hypothetical protein